MHINYPTTLGFGEKYQPKHYSTCKTEGVMYLLLCECSCFYVGKTKMECWQRASRHIHAMKTCDPDLPLGRHVTTVHRASFPKISFLILDRIHPGTRGGDWNKILLQHEQKWIFHLNATSLPGINESLSFRPFLE